MAWNTQTITFIHLLIHFPWTLTSISIVQKQLTLTLINLFSSSLFSVSRSAQLVYESDSEVHGIKTFRFVLSDTNFQAPMAHPSSACFCTQRQPRMRDGICDVSGILNVSTCSDGAPIALSAAHFLGGDKHLTDDVDGLRPSTLEHQMFIDIEPVSELMFF